MYLFDFSAWRYGIADPDDMLFLETTSQNTSSGTGVWVKQTIGPFIPYVKIQGSRVLDLKLTIVGHTQV